MRSGRWRCSPSFRDAVAVAADHVPAWGCAPSANPQRRKVKLDGGEWLGPDVDVALEDAHLTPAVIIIERVQLEQPRDQIDQPDVADAVPGVERPLLVAIDSLG